MTDMRTQLARTATDLLERDPKVAVVLAEISVDRFERAIAMAPDRVINVGIMEQTLVGVAAGFAMEGFHTIAHTMAPFLVERPFEQVKLDFGYQGLAGTLASVGAPYDYGTEGGTHHSPGDVGVVLTVPRTDVLVPGCAGELDRLLRETYADGRLTYLRASVAQNDVAFEVARGRLEVVRRGTRRPWSSSARSSRGRSRLAKGWTSPCSTRRAWRRSTPAGSLPSPVPILS